MYGFCFKLLGKEVFTAFFIFTPHIYTSKWLCKGIQILEYFEIIYFPIPCLISQNCYRHLAVEVARKYWTLGSRRVAQYFFGHIAVYFAYCDDFIVVGVGFALQAFDKNN